MFVEVAFQFPTVIWTIALGFAVIYWLLVAVAGVDVDVAGGVHGAFDGGAHAAVDGALHGAAHAGGEASGAIAGHAAEAHGAAEAAAVGASPPRADTGLRRRLRSVPVTVMLTVLVGINFFLCHLGSYALGAVLGGSLPYQLVATVILVAVFFLSLPIASLVIRPLAPLFHTHKAATRASIVGKEAEITTGTVDQEFGQARLEDGGPGLIIQVRADREADFKRGERVLLISFDDQREAYEIARLDIHK